MATEDPSETRLEPDDLPSAPHNAARLAIEVIEGLDVPEIEERSSKAGDIESELERELELESGVSDERTFETSFASVEASGSALRTARALGPEAEGLMQDHRGMKAVGERLARSERTFKKNARNGEFWLVKASARRPSESVKSSLGP